VSHDRQEPGSWVITRKRVEGTECADIGILDGVLGVIPALQDPVRQVVRSVPMREQMPLKVWLGYHGGVTPPGTRERLPSRWQSFGHQASASIDRQLWCDF